MGSTAFAAFCVTLTVVLPEQGTGTAFGLATAVALGVQTAILLLRSRFAIGPSARGAS